MLWTAHVCSRAAFAVWAGFFDLTGPIIVS